MLFRFSGVVQNFGLRDDGISNLAVTIGKVQIGLRGERSEGSVQLACEATLETEPKPHIRDAFESLAGSRLPQGSLPPDRWPKPLAQVTPTGEIRGPLRSVPPVLMPDPFQQFAGNVQRDLVAAANKVVGLLRWRSGELGPVRPFDRPAISWSLGDGKWHDFPGDTSLVLAYFVWLDLRPDAEQELDQLVAVGQVEPFAYELLREAWALSETNPRSSLLLAITALEVAVKQFIADRVEGSGWLVNNMPSPEVIAILRDYLPTLVPPPGALERAAKLEPLSDELLDLLRKRRDQRNRITHSPQAHRQSAELATADRAQSAVLAVRQVLLRLDVANGHEWAREHISEPPYAAPSGGSRRVGRPRP
ncbi:MAG: hypothetical protein ACXVH1_27950 [Solirubrobacteraceae bacterium]